MNRSTDRRNLTDVYSSSNNQEILMKSDYVTTLLSLARAECMRLGSKPATTVGYDELEKMVELVVKECADVAQGSVWANFPDSDVSATRVASRIKKHFGVEE